MTSMGSVGEFEKATADGSGWHSPSPTRSGFLHRLRGWLSMIVAVARREAEGGWRVARDWWHTLGETSPRWFMVLFGTWLVGAGVLAFGAAVYGAIRLS